MNFNNNMKQVLHILLTLLLLFTFSCNDDNVNNDNNSILIGSWGEQFPADEFFELTFYNDDTGVMTVYYNEGKKKSPDPFTYSFDKNTMRLVIVFDSDPEPPIVYDDGLRSKRNRWSNQTVLYFDFRSRTGRYRKIRQ